MSTKALTLIELMISVVLFAILTVSAFYIFRAILISWSSQEIRTEIHTVLDRGIEEMARKLRGVKDVDFRFDDEIRFTTVGNTHHIYYLYNKNDPYPLSEPFANSYELRMADLSGAVGMDLRNRPFTYGTGKIILTDVLPPNTTDLSISGNIATLDISVSRGNETVRSRTEVRPRNL